MSSISASTLADGPPNSMRQRRPSSQPVRCRLDRMKVHRVPIASPPVAAFPADPVLALLTFEEWLPEAVSWGTFTPKKRRKQLSIVVDAVVIRVSDGWRQ